MFGLESPTCPNINFSSQRFLHNFDPQTATPASRTNHSIGAARPFQTKVFTREHINQVSAINTIRQVASRTLDREQPANLPINKNLLLGAILVGSALTLVYLISRLTYTKNEITPIERTEERMIQSHEMINPLINAVNIRDDIISDLNPQLNLALNSLEHFQSIQGNYLNRITQLETQIRHLQNFIEARDFIIEAQNIYVDNLINIIQNQRDQIRKLTAI